MARTKIHRGRALFNAGKTDEPEVEIYLNHCKRRNREKGYFKAIQREKEETIMDVEMMREVANA